MTISCYKCGLYLGDILAGSKLRKGIYHICNECVSGRPKPKLKDDPTVDMLRSMFGMK